MLVAGFFGGPLAGSLDASGGFANDDADSVRAVERIEAATGAAPGAGIVIVVDTPQGLPADTARVQEVTDALAAEPGIVQTTSPTTTRGDPALVSRDGTQVLVLGTLAADADDETVAEAVLDTFDGRDDVTVGGSAVVGLQLGSTVTEDLARAEMLRLPGPDRAVADLLPRPRRPRSRSSSASRPCSAPSWSSPASTRSTG